MPSTAPRSSISCRACAAAGSGPRATIVVS
jgi:hypothetical protein